MVDNTTGFDTTINYRRTNYYQNLTASCGANCTYLGIDSNNYINCNCSITTPTVQPDFLQEVLSDLPTFNFDVILCFEQTFVIDNVAQNPALYCVVIFNRFSSFNGWGVTFF